MDLRKILVRWKNRAGFTLVEIMVAVTIMAVLAIVGFTIYTKVIEKARIAKANQDLDVIRKSMQIARQRDNLVLGKITGSWCSECLHCRPPHKTTDADCIADMQASYAHITSAPMPMDPWGGAYAYDENESEPGKLACCIDPPNVNTVEDFISSAGPDHILYTSDDLHQQIGPLVCNYDKMVVDTVNACVCTSGPNCVL